MGESKFANFVKGIVNKLPEKMFCKFNFLFSDKYPLISLIIAIILAYSSFQTFIGRGVFLPALILTYLNGSAIRHSESCKTLLAVAFVVSVVAFICAVNELLNTLMVFG